MVLELRVPHGADLDALTPLVPLFLTYVLSFVFLGIYWNNHHHLLQAAEKVNGKILWANLHLLFWLSLFPSSPGGWGRTASRPIPVAVYGVILLAAAVAYYILVRTLLAREAGLAARQAVGNDRKGKASPLLYAVAIPIAFVAPFVSFGIYRARGGDLVRAGPADRAGPRGVGNLPGR